MIGYVFLNLRSRSSSANDETRSPALPLSIASVPLRVFSNRSEHPPRDHVIFPGRKECSAHTSF